LIEFAIIFLVIDHNIVKKIQNEGNNRNLT